MLTVIKMGGSLMPAAELDDWLTAIATLAKDFPLVIVPGGGAFADHIRTLQTNLSLSDKLAHQLALLSMCQFGYFLAARCAAIELVGELGKLACNINPGRPQLWLPYALLHDAGIPPSWDYTADSIALWLAITGKAKRLILVKSKTLARGEAELTDLIQNRSLDRGFAKFYNAYPGEVIWLGKKEYDKLPECLKGAAKHNSIISV